MKIAVISDIHSNIGALKAVLYDIEKKQVDAVVCAGDLVGYCPYPNEVIDLIRERKIKCVMGNYDDAIGNSRVVCGCDYSDEKAREIGERSLSWTGEHILPENKEFLRNLPREIYLITKNIKVNIVHGSPRQLNEYLYENINNRYLEELLIESHSDVLICGHTHIPYHKVINRHKHIINAGSVGRPKHGDPQAIYSIVEIDDQVKVTFHKVPYDYESTAAAIISAGLPEEFAAELRTGRA